MDGQNSGRIAVPTRDPFTFSIVSGCVQLLSGVIAIRRMALGLPPVAPAVLFALTFSLQVSLFLLALYAVQPEFQLYRLITAALVPQIWLMAAGWSDNSLSQQWLCGLASGLLLAMSMGVCAIYFPLTALVHCTKWLQHVHVATGTAQPFTDGTIHSDGNIVSGNEANLAGQPPVIAEIDSPAEALDFPAAAQRPELVACDSVLGEQLAQCVAWQMRQLNDEGDTLEGTCPAEFTLEGREAIVHVVFQPAFLQIPDLELEPLDEDDVELRVEQVFRYGARIAVRRPVTSRDVATVRVSYRATSTRSRSAA